MKERKRGRDKRWGKAYLKFGARGKNRGTDF